MTPAHAAVGPSIDAPGGIVWAVEAGALTTVQDRGRPGWAHLGVPRAGAVDPRALGLANRLVGNPPDAAALEATLAGPTLQFDTAAWVAVTGARAPVTVDGRRVGMDVAEAVPRGGVLRIGAASSGLRTYVAVRGGISVSRMLGSRSTDTLAGLGPPPLRAGDELPFGTCSPLGPIWHEVAPAPPLPDEPSLRVRPGPRMDWFADPSRLTSAHWSVRPESDRTGLRLSGPVLARRAARAGAELPSEGLVAGAVQVPPDGQPVLFLANHPTTGGYPVIGVVAAEDLWLAGQLRPGQSLGLRWG